MELLSFQFLLRKFEVERILLLLLLLLSIRVNLEK